MNQYHKIKTVYKRDRDTHKLIEGVYSTPEFEYLANNSWVFTEKVDGTNIRVRWDGISVTFRGKTDNSQMMVSLYEKLCQIFFPLVQNNEMKEVLGTEGDTCLYGEGYGARIQKGGGNYISYGVDFVLFDIKIGKWWLERKNIEDIALKLSLDTVPLIGIGTLPEFIKRGREGFQSRWGNFQAEGLVAKPRVEIFNRNGNRIITKVKYKDFYREKN